MIAGWLGGASFAHEGVVQKVAQRIGYAAGIAVTERSFSKKGTRPARKDGKPAVIHVDGHPYALKARDARCSDRSSSPRRRACHSDARRALLAAHGVAWVKAPRRARCRSAHEAKLSADSER